MPDRRTIRMRAWLMTGIVAGLGAVLGLSSPGREAVTAPPAVPGPGEREAARVPEALALRARDETRPEADGGT